MRVLTVLFSAVLCAGTLFGAAFSTYASAGSDDAPVRVGDFALLDHTGKFHQLSYYGDQQAVALLVYGNDSELARSSVAEFVELAQRHTDAAVTFLLLNSDSNITRQALSDTAQKAGITLPILHDESQLVAETLKARAAGETFVIDPHTMNLAYRGPLSSPELEDTLTALIGDAEYTAQQLDVQGQPLAFEARKPVSYIQDVVPILKDNCVQCHHEGGIAPWAMSSHAMVRGWAAMMREVILTRRMPPGQIDTHVGKPIANAAKLTSQHKRVLIDWIDAGAPHDGDTDPLTNLEYENPKFTYGTPDLVFKIPPQEIPATGVIDYRYVPVQLNLDRDVWVKAMEFVPGDRQVLHHVIAYVSSPADKSVRGRQTGAANGESVGGFAPGRGVDVFPDNSGRLIRKGSNLLLQMHYTTSGKATVDETEIGLFIYEQPPKYVMGGGVAGQRRFLVPPHVKEHKLQGEQLIERDAYLYAMMPHMHYRGKYMSYAAVYPDGTRETLLSVPKYDFNWQFNYFLEEPLFLPAGSKLVAMGAMDNSARNPANPDPTKPVHFGLQTKHEMFFGFTTLRYVGETPEKLMAGKSDSVEGPAGR